jgi:hypothetical protein
MLFAPSHQSAGFEPRAWYGQQPTFIVNKADFLDASGELATSHFTAQIRRDLSMR